MRRFVQADQLKDVNGSALQSVSCQGIKDQFPGGELVIGDKHKEVFGTLKPDKQKAALLGMRAFWGQPYHTWKPIYLLTIGFARI